PTAREFRAFAHLLDKLMADNLNLDFFGSEVPRTVTERNGSTRLRGTMELLESWLSIHFRLEDKEAVPSIMKAFRKVRKLRSGPAHTIGDDEFDQKYLKQQRELVLEVNEALNLLTAILRLHPKGAEYEVPEWWRSVTIWNY